MNAAGTLVAPYDDSILKFSYLVSQETRFPAVGQIKYSCIHQKNICNLHPGNFFDTLQDLPGQIPRRVLSSITELSFALTRSTDEMNFPLTLSHIRSIDSPCWPMEMVNSPNLRKVELSFNWRGCKPRLASVFSVHLLPNLTLLRFNECLFEDREVKLATLPDLAHWVLEDYNIASSLFSHWSSSGRV